MTTLHDFTLRTLDGEERGLDAYAGKVVLIVNVASECGLTPQYEGLEELHRAYGDRGLVVLGVPCNQFGGQEPGDEATIKAFCTTRYDVTFPMSSKLDVNGPGRHPLYQWLTAEPTEPDGPGDVQWNFGKFLVGKDGAVLARFAPTTTPTSEKVVRAIEAALAA
ncbi:MAG: glutathione peroxidase [Myxococcales bacterium]|nr:glutathione peroxidase [Myxococcales bacterium]